MSPNLKTVLSCGVATAVLIYTTAAIAEGTAASTSITNTATVDYQVGGVDQTAEVASDTFQVDRKINLTLVENDSLPTLVAPGQTGAVTVFQLTNLSNSTLDFSLSASQLIGGASIHGESDNFNLTSAPTVFVGNDLDGIYNAAEDTASFVDELAPDATVFIYVLGDIPGSVLGGDVAGVELLAIAREAGSAGLGGSLTQDALNSVGVETVFADGSGVSDTARDASFSARDSYKADDLPVDLEVEITSDNTSPLAGFDQYTITVSVTNNGPANASGVVVEAPRPSGNGVISDTSAGSWIRATGVWSVGGLAIGETKSFSYTVSTSTNGVHDATAEVVAVDQTDLDSDPATSFDTDDLADGISDDDEALVSITAVRGTGTVIARSCASGISNLDWSTQSWTPTSTTGSFNVAGKPITISIADPNGAIVSSSPYFTPAKGPFYQGGLASTDSGLNIAATDAALVENGVVTTFTVGPVGIGVEDLRLNLFDVDGNTAHSRYEGVEVSGSLNGVPVAPMLEGGSVISISGNQARGTDDSPTSGTNSGRGTLQVGFSGRVDTVIIKWGNAPGTTTVSGGPGFAFHDVTFCTPATSLDVEKTSTSFDPANPFRIPGSAVIYNIGVTNTGEVPTDIDSLFLVDSLPDDLEFYNDDFDSAGPASDPVGFAQTGTGLTFNYATDVGFATGPGAPVNFAACNYSPISGYDPAVKFICLNPKGRLESTDPDSSAEFSFRARIK